VGMNGERARVVLVGVLCVLAVVAAAATLTSPQQTGTATGGASVQSDGPADYEGDGGDSTADPLVSQGQIDLDVGACVPWLSSGPFWVAVFVVAAGIWLVARHRQDPLAATAYVSLLALPFSFAWLLLNKCGHRTEPPEGLVPTEVVATPEGGDATYGLVGEAGAFSSPVWLVALVAAVGVGAVAVALARDRGEADEPDDELREVVDVEGYEDVEALGAVAGRAADRIERAAAVDNEVYRAWVAMTERLDVEHPESSTPGEFAAAAVAAGVDPETVAELTALFERVRYGDEAPTAEAESRAVEALRDIEANRDDLDALWGADP